MFITPAFAQAAQGAGPSGFESMIPLILIIVVFYFFLIRPQQKKQKEHKTILGAIRRGDRIVTGGGILGVVKKVIDDNEVQVEIADGVSVRVRRELISTVLAKTEPAPKDKASGKSGVPGKESGEEKDEENK